MSKDESTDKALLQVLSQKASNTIAIFCKGEYFTVYGEDAVFIASRIFRSSVCLKSFSLNNGQKMEFISVNRGQYEKVVREAIVILKFSVELYETDSGTWKLVKRGSPGNTVEFEAEIGVGEQAPVFAIYLHPSAQDNHVSLCALDAGSFRFVTCEFNDSPNFSRVEQIIIGLSPSEYMLIEPTGSSEREKKLATLFSKMQVHRTPKTASEQLKPKSTWEEVESIVHEDFKAELEASSDKVKDCAMWLVSNVLEDTEPIKGKYGLVNYGSCGHMHIDASAVEALELFELSYNYLDKSNTMTLYSAFNRCKTVSGQRLLRDWLCRPLSDVDRINERLDIVEVLTESPTVCKKLHESVLAKMPDCAQLARRLIRKSTLQDLNRLYQVTKLMEVIDTQLNEIREMENGRFVAAVDRLLHNDVRHIVDKMTRFTVLCDEFIDFDYERETKEIRVRVDQEPAMVRVQEEIERVDKIAEKIRRKYSNSLGIDAMKLDKNTQYGYYFRITLKEEKNIRQSKQVVVLETTKGAGIKFTVGELSDLNEEFLELNKQYTDAQEQVTSRLIAMSEEFLPLIPSVATVVSVIDVLVSLATVASASSRPYTRPIILAQGTKKLVLKQCRHPIIEMTSDRQFIPNDVVFDENRLIVLTGANMGGKSTYLRSAALCILLAQIGSFVPSSHAEISVVDGIYTRVGASDNQSRGISTFMAEMLDCSGILQRATENSFVVIDELGRGTSTFDGFGIASAIAKDILNRVKCLCIFATHFHEMGELAEQEGAVALQMGVQLHDNEIHMLYKVSEGVAKSSFGLQVAQMVGIDSGVIEKANQILSELENKPIWDDASIDNLKKSDDLRQEILRMSSSLLG